MKKIIIIAAIALFTINVSAKNNPEEPNQNLRTEIINLLKDNLSFKMDQNHVTIDVIFTINNKSELVIISTNSKSKEIEYQLKKKLNYKKIDFRTAKPGEMFLLPLKINKS